MSEFLNPGQTDGSPQALEFVANYNQALRDEWAAWRLQVAELRKEGFTAAINLFEVNKSAGTVTIQNRLGITEYGFLDRLEYGGKVAVLMGSRSSIHPITLLEPVPGHYGHDSWRQMTFKFSEVNPHMEYWIVNVYQTGIDKSQYCARDKRTGIVQTTTLTGRYF